MMLPRRSLRAICSVWIRAGATGFINGITIFDPNAAIPMHTHNCEESVLLLEGDAFRDRRRAV